MPPSSSSSSILLCQPTSSSPSNHKKNQNDKFKKVLSFQQQATFMTYSILHRPYLQTSNYNSNSNVASASASPSSNNDNEMNISNDSSMNQPSPFISPSLLYSNQNPFLYSILTTTNIINTQPTNSTTTITSSSHYLPSMIGIHIHTPLQLLYSIQCIELDYIYHGHYQNYYQIKTNISSITSSGSNDRDHSIIPLRLWNDLNRYLTVLNKDNEEEEDGAGESNDYRNIMNSIGIQHDYEFIHGIAYINNERRMILDNQHNNNNNNNSQIKGGGGSNNNDMNHHNFRSQRNIQLLKQRIRKRKSMARASTKSDDKIMNNYNEEEQDYKCSNSKPQVQQDQQQQEKEQQPSSNNNDTIENMFLQERHETISQLTSLVLDSTLYNNQSHKQQFPTTTSSDNQSLLFTKYSHIPKRVCQYPFQKNDIVWVCRTCQADETCVLCHECFKHSNHNGHDVSFYNAQAGGCCDCGDVDAWDENGFCHLHGSVGGSGGLEEDVEWKVKGVLNSCVEYIISLADNVEVGYERANGGRIMVVDKKIREDYHNSIGGSDDGGENRYFDSDDDNIIDCEINNDYATTLDNKIDIDDEVGSQTFEDAKNDSASATSSGYEMEVDREEFKFDPKAASTSKSRNNSSPTTSLSPSSYKTAFSTYDDDPYNFNVVTKKDESNDENDEIFNPEAASESKSRSFIEKKRPHLYTNTKHQQPSISTHLSPAHQLGLLGLQQNGLYLILHRDYVHDHKDFTFALRRLFQSFSSGAYSSSSPMSHNYNYESYDSLTSTTLNQVLNLIPLLFYRKDVIGEMIVWGTFELMEELGPVLSQCYKDGDSIACARFGALMLEKAKMLREEGMVVSIKTRDELCQEVRALAVVEFLKMLSDSCDPFCNIVTLAFGGFLDENRMEIDGARGNKGVSGDPKCLRSMLCNDLKLPRMIAKTWHDLLLKLLAVPSFKAALSNAYVDTYSSVAAEFARGVGSMERSPYSLSVQFLNRITYVQDLVKHKDLLGCLFRSLLEILQVSKLSAGDFDDEDIFNPRVDVTHPLIVYRRYVPVVSDLKCALHVPGIAHFFSSIPMRIDSKSKNGLDAWIEILSLAQNMDPQIWRSMSEGHVPIEPRSWIPAFNLSINLGTLYEKMLMWKDEDWNPHDVNEYSLTFLSAIELTQYILLNGVEIWQRVEVKRIESDAADTYGTALNLKMCQPMSTVAMKHGCSSTIQVLPTDQKSGWSFHLPLHRFLSACLKEVAKRSYQTMNVNGIGLLLANLKSSADVLKLVHLFNGLLEFPTNILCRAAQIRSNLWLRNGTQVMKMQLLNYSEPALCKNLRDLDLFLVQFSLVANYYLQSNYSIYNEGSQRYNCSGFICLLIHRFGLFDFLGFKCLQVKEARDDKATNDPDRLSLMLDELLHLVIILITELPPPQANDPAAYLSQAKQRLRREVVHRLVSGPKAHSDLSALYDVLPHQDNVSISITI